MKNKQIILILILIFFISGCALPHPKIVTYRWGKLMPTKSNFKMPEPTDYKVGIDDTLEVNIWQHPDLSKEVKVRPDGKISYLLVGDMQAAGLTVAELDDVITKKFERYAKELQKKEMQEEPEPVEGEYHIGLGDELDIKVWKIQDLSMRVTVRPDGRFSYPLIGDILAHGKTPTELADELKQKLADYVRNPQISVLITRFGKIERRRITFVTEFISTFLEEKPEISILVKAFGSRKVIVLGRVRSPGIYNLEGNAKLLDAIAYASGFENDAVKDNIFVIRGDIYANPTVIKINAWDIIRHGNFVQNIPIQNQDIVYAPRSIVGNINVLVGQIQPAVTLLNNSVTLKDALKATVMMAD